MACMRFSAWSKTIEAGPSNTSSVTSMHVMPNACAISVPTAVCVLWNAGDRIIDAAQHACRVLDRFLVTYLAPARTEIGDVRALIVSSHLKTSAGTRGILFKDQGDVLALEPGCFETSCLCSLELSCKPQQEADLGGAQLAERQNAATLEVDGHGGASDLAPQCLGEAASTPRRHRNSSISPLNEGSPISANS